MGIEALLDYGLAGGVDQLGAVVFLDEAEGVLEVEVEVRPEDIVEIQVHSFLMSFHLNSYGNLLQL